MHELCAQFAINCFEKGKENTCVMYRHRISRILKTMVAFVEGNWMMEGRGRFFILYPFHHLNFEPHELPIPKNEMKNLNGVAKIFSSCPCVLSRGSQN